MQKGKDNKEKGKSEPQNPSKIQNQAPSSTFPKEQKAAPLAKPKVEQIGISGFIEEKLQAHIQQGLKEVVHFRPQDPIKFLGQFLLKRSQQFK